MGREIAPGERGGRDQRRRDTHADHAVFSFLPWNSRATMTKNIGT